MPIEPGDSFAGYIVERLLGSGGMGEVYLAQHPRLPREDALKVLRPDVSSDKEFRQRFIREADLASALKHPNIVTVYDRGEFNEQLWIATEYVDGVDAAQLMKARYPAGMPVDEAVSIISPIASALDYAHDRGLLHRDVKPANILLAKPDRAGQRRVFLADFGIARPMADPNGLTATNLTLGTVAYAAPEQLMGESLDGRTDQYALAATAYHLLTGLQLFPHSNPAVVISRHLNAPVPALADTRPELASLDPVLAVGLAKNREDRYASCADFSRALAEQDRHDGPTPIATTAHAPTQRRTDATPAPPTTGPGAPNVQGSAVIRWLVPATLLVVAAIGIIVWHPWDSRRDASTSTPGASTSTPGASSSTNAARDNPPSSAAAPERPTLPASATASVLLTAPEISKILGGIQVSGDPGNAVSAILALDTSSYGPLDHSRAVDPVECAGVVFTGDQAAYGGTNVEAMKTESFSPGPYVAGDDGPWQLQQTAAVFPSAESARTFMADQQRQWAACGTPVNPPYPDFPTIDVSVILGYENGRSFILGNVERVGEEMIVISMASNSPVWGAHACQQALGVRNNVVAEARTCQVPRNAASIDGMEPANPDWAMPDAQRLVAAMLRKVS